MQKRLVMKHNEQNDPSSETSYRSSVCLAPLHEQKTTPTRHGANSAAHTLAAIWYLGCGRGAFWKASTNKKQTNKPAPLSKPHMGRQAIGILFHSGQPSCTHQYAGLSTRPQPGCLPRPCQKNYELPHAPVNETLRIPPRPPIAPQIQTKLGTSHFLSVRCAQMHGRCVWRKQARNCGGAAQFSAFLGGICGIPWHGFCGALKRLGSEPLFLLRFEVLQLRRCLRRMKVFRGLVSTGRMHGKG